ncbi:MAG: terminase small subunit protein, partial [Mesorhizobium sp.]
TNADGSTTEQVNSEHIQRSRLRIDTRKWVAERMRPKKYGSKVALTDGDGGPLVVQVLKLSEANADNPASE